MSSDTFFKIFFVNKIIVSPSSFFTFQYYHLDVYTSPLPPSCGGQQLMLLETYTTAPVGDKNEPPLPDFMTIAKEVTGDPTYSMYNIAKIESKALNGH